MEAVAFVVLVVELVGFFLFKFRESNPLNFEEVTVWNSKLEIDDVSITVMRGQD